jgi:hypothetical protein
MEKTSLVTALSCLLLALAPLGAAHLTNPAGSATSEALTGDGCRYRGTLAGNGGSCPTNSGVSGTYIGAAGVAVSGDIFPLSINAVVTVCPLGYCSVANSYCDLEGLDESAPDNPLKALDESTVDGTPGNGGMVDDGTWDDGGQGGACHTNGYGDASYNTLGCSGTSHAEDAGSEYHVWISASCDDSSQVSDGGPVLCLVIAIQSGGNGGDGCVLDALCEGCGEFASCGADGTADEVNLGEGGGDFDEAASTQVPFSNDPSAPGGGVPYPLDIAACDPFATAATFVFEGVEANAGIGSDPAGVEYTTAVGGWIDSTNSSSFLGAAGCTVVHVNVPGVIDICSNVGTPGCTTVVSAGNTFAWCAPSAPGTPCNVYHLGLGILDVCTNLGQHGCTTVYENVGSDSVSWCA